MKKRFIACLTVLLLLTVLLSGCKQYVPNEVLYVYNWGEYIDEEIN